MGIGSLEKSVDRALDNAWIDIGHCVVVDAEPLQNTGGIVVEDDVGGDDLGQLPVERLEFFEELRMGDRCAGQPIVAFMTPHVEERHQQDLRVGFRVLIKEKSFCTLATLVLAPRVDQGVLIGIAVGIAAHLWREVRVPLQSRIEGDVLHVEPHGVLFFASAPSLQDEINALVAANPGLRRLVLHLGGLGRIDLTGALVLRDLVNGAEQGGLEVEVVDVPPQAEKVVARTLAAYEKALSAMAADGAFKGA